MSVDVHADFVEAAEVVATEVTIGFYLVLVADDSDRRTPCSSEPSGRYSEIGNRRIRRSP